MIDGTHVKEWLTCPRLPFLAFHAAAPNEQVSARLQLLMQSGRRVERRVLAGLEAVSADFPAGDLAAGHAATMELVGRRVPAIAQGVLAVDDLVGRPDLLLWNADDQSYEVVDVKSSQHIHAASRMQVAFYSRLLARLDRPPRRGHLIVRDGTWVPIAVRDLEASVDHLIGRLAELRASPAHDPGPVRIEACADCRYRRHCLDALASRADIGLLPGVTRAQVTALRAAGIDDLERLAELATPHAAATDDGLTPELVRRLRAVARAVLDGKPQPLLSRGAEPRPELGAAQLALAALHDRRYAPAAIAIAGLVIDEPDKFRVRFLREREAAEPLAGLRELLRNLERTTGPIAVFGSSVERALDDLAQGAPDIAGAVDRRLRPRLVDIRAELRRAFALPDFDRTPLLAARAAGIAAGDDSVDLEVLRYLEEEPEAEPAAIEAMLRRDLLAMTALRDLVLRR